MVNDSTDSGDHEARKLLETHFAPLSDPAMTMKPVASEGSFSGAKVWKVTSRGAPFALRRWQKLSETDQRRLLWSHLVLSKARECGCHLLPVPVPDSLGKTLIEWGDDRWQLEPWLPGNPLEESCGAETVRRTFHAVSQMHTFLARVEKSRGPSPSMAKRQEQLRHWYSAGTFTLRFAQLEEASFGDPRISEIAESILSSFCRLAHSLEVGIRKFADVSCELQPVHGDLRHEHVLLDPELESVSGIVDPGAMKIDSTALDIARLAGGLAGNRADKWEEILRSLLEIGLANVTLIQWARVFHATGVTLAGMNWLKWLVLEKRHMGSFDAIKARMGKISAGMETLVLNL